MRDTICWLAVSIGMMTSAMGAPDASIFDQKPKKSRTFNSIQYIAQNGRTVSFGGDGLKWKGKGDCSQTEHMEPVISVQGDGVTVRNAVIIKSPDGVHVSGKNVVLENLIFPKVCEDAITSNGADNLIIRNCAFRGADDKAIQLNSGRNIVIENCYFEGCSKPVRVKPGVTVTVRDNVSVDSTAFVMADGTGAHAIVENNDVKKSKWFAKAESGSVIEIGANTTSDILHPDEAAGGGSVLHR